MVVLPAAIGSLIAIRYATLFVLPGGSAVIGLPLSAYFFVYAGGRVAPSSRVAVGMWLTALLFFAFAEIPWLSYPWTLAQCERGWVETFIAAGGAVAAWQLFKEKRDAERERNHTAELREYREAFEKAAEAAGWRKEEG